MTVVILWVVRILVVLLVLRVLLRAITGARMPSQRRPARIGGSLVRDPHCGTYLPAARALTLSSRGHVLHFCSDRCLDAWTSAHGR